MKKIKEKAKTQAQRAKEKAKKFNLELRKAFSTAIIAAFGFLTALAWRDVLTEWLDKIEAINPLHGKIITALIVTFLSALIILLMVEIIPSDKK